LIHPPELKACFIFDIQNNAVVEVDSLMSFDRSSIDIEDLRWDRGDVMSGGVMSDTSDGTIGDNSLLVPLKEKNDQEQEETDEMKGKIYPRYADESANKVQLRHVLHELRASKFIHFLFPKSSPGIKYEDLCVLESTWIKDGQRKDDASLEQYDNGGYLFVQQRAFPLKDDKFDAGALKGFVDKLYRIVSAWIRHGFFHNDIHCGNVMQLDGNPVLIDFDLSRLVPPVLTDRGIDLVSRAQLWAMCLDQPPNNAVLDPDDETTVVKDPPLISKAIVEFITSEGAFDKYELSGYKQQDTSLPPTIQLFTDEFNAKLETASGETKKSYQNLKDYLTLWFYVPWLSKLAVDNKETSNPKGVVKGFEDWIFLIRNLDPAAKYEDQNVDVASLFIMSQIKQQAPDQDYLATIILKHFYEEGPRRRPKDLCVKTSYTVVN